ncbi:isoprenyl transferase [Porphyromonadaceae bacterium]
MTAELDHTRIPKHIAIIMDGNGRWAKMQGKSRIYGHQAGVVSVKETIKAANDLGVKYLTLYTFSTENWNRPDEEVNALMSLMVTAIERETDEMMRENVRLFAIGNFSQLPEKTHNTLKKCIERTSMNSGVTIVLALSYSSRWEILNALKRMIADGVDEKMITEENFSSYLTTNQIPDPELLIRTGGEQRISNFLLWQLSYSELYFTDIYWPDFRKPQLVEAIADYQQRERRFGKTSEQLI